MGLRALQWANHKTPCWLLAFTIFFIWYLSPLPSFAQTALAVTPPKGASVPAAEFAAPYRARLTLRVYNYARLGQGSLAISEKIAEKIFRGVGLETVWVDCPTSIRNVRAFASCDTPMGPADFVLRILPRAMAVKMPRSEDSLGSAQICSASEPACELNIFYHRVDELAAKGYRGDRILAYAIAHEITHVLLGPKHSDDGIMRASWTTSDLERISLGIQLGFTDNQSTQLRIALLHRIVNSSPNIFAQANQTAP